MKHFNVIIFIKSKKKVRLKRFIKNKGNKKLFNFLNSQQLPDKRKIKFCDHIVVNEKNLKILKKFIKYNIKICLKFLDTETTGLSFKDGHKIVEIACIETNDLIPTGNIFHKLINPQRSMPNEAFKVHGFSDDFLKDKETFNQIVDEFINFIKDKKIIIHNASFDLSFLDGELNLLKKDKINKKLVVDSLEIARNKYPGASNSLDALCKKFNVDLSRRTKHNALLDCELLREVYINLLDVKEPKLNLSNNSLENNITKAKDYNKTIVKISEDEINKHNRFLKSELKKNFY